jgi:hypothetical protein
VELTNVDGPVLEDDDTFSLLLGCALSIFSLIADAELFLSLSTVENGLIILQEINDISVLVKLYLEKNVIREIAVEVRDLLHFLKLILLCNLDLTVVVNVRESFFDGISTIVSIFVTWIRNESLEMKNVDFIGVVCPDHKILGTEALVLHQSLLNVQLLEMHVN